jgi:hypothetical protein
MRSEQDARPTVGTFLASGQEFVSTKSHFEQVIKRLTCHAH